MPKVLFVGGCPAPWHRIESSEPPIRAALESIGLTVDSTGIYHPGGGNDYIGDYSAISAENLKGYDAVALHTTGKACGADLDALVEYVRAGGALVGIHNAADSFKDHAGYIETLGAAFRTHPEQLDIAVEFVDTDHPITRGLAPFTVHDELYLFQAPPKDVHLLAQTRSYDDDGPVPLCWTREPGAGRVFYLSLGHNPEVLADTHWQALFTRGVRWAMKQL